MAMARVGVRRIEPSNTRLTRWGLRTMQAAAGACQERVNSGRSLDSVGVTGLPETAA
jgi:hypothetical protein